MVARAGASWPTRLPHPAFLPAVHCPCAASCQRSPTPHANSTCRLRPPPTGSSLPPAACRLPLADCRLLPSSRRRPGSITPLHRQRHDRTQPVQTSRHGPRPAPGRRAVWQSGRVALGMLASCERKRLSGKCMPHPDRRQKKTRQLPAGSESFGRGCLKGRICMHCSELLCKCEMIKIGCIFCNYYHKPMILRIFQFVSFATRRIRSVANCLHHQVANRDGAPHKPLLYTVSGHTPAARHCRSGG